MEEARRLCRTGSHTVVFESWLVIDALDAVKWAWAGYATDVVAVPFTEPFVRFERQRPQIWGW